MKPRKYTYTLKSTLLEQVIANYIDYVSNPLHIWRQFVNVTTDGKETYNHGEGIKPMPLKTRNNLEECVVEEIMNLPKPRYETARSQIISVVDTLYRRYLNSDDENGYFTMSSKVLKAASSNYYYILETLSKMLIIDIDYSVTEGQYNRTLYLIRDESIFHLQATSTLDRITQKSIQKLEEYSDKKHQEEIDKAMRATSAKFVERYNNNLSKLKIDKAAASSYVSNEYNSEQDKHKKRKRLHTIDKITSVDYKKEIRSIDDNGRLYHIGTELQRDIKKFTNILFSIDCKNSHPFLFSYLLLRYETKGKIDIEENYKDEVFHSILYMAMLYLKECEGNYNHYTFSNFAIKYLENKKLTKSNLAKTEKIIQSFENIEPDVWRYIYDVSEGKIWDMFVEAFHEERTIVKQSVFASVIYSYPKKREKNLDEERAKWVNMFKTLYPTVYTDINEIKKSLHNQCVAEGKVTELKYPYTVMIGTYSVTYTQKDDILLSMLLMRLESKIFTNILTKLFNKRVVCFGIHDAVAVIKSKLSEEDIKQIMMDEYKEYGLIPTLSVDYYN